MAWIPLILLVDLYVCGYIVDMIYWSSWLSVHNKSTVWTKTPPMKRCCFTELKIAKADSLNFNRAMGAQQMMRDLRMNMIPIKNRLLFFFSMTLKICPGCHPQFNINLTFYSFFYECTFAVYSSLYPPVQTDGPNSIGRFGQIIIMCRNIAKYKKEIKSKLIVTFQSHLCMCVVWLLRMCRIQQMWASYTHGEHG